MAKAPGAAFGEINRNNWVFTVAYHAIESQLLMIDRIVFDSQLSSSRHELHGWLLQEW